MNLTKIHGTLSGCLLAWLADWLVGWLAGWLLAKETIPTIGPYPGEKSETHILDMGRFWEPRKPFVHYNQKIIVFDANVSRKLVA